MKRNEILITILFLTLLIIMSCTDKDIVGEGEANGRVIGSVHGVIIDYHNQERLDSVQVTWATKDKIKSTLTDNLGYYAITNLSSGTYELTFSGDGYAICCYQVKIPDITEVGITDIGHSDDFNYSEVLNLPLFPKNANLNGLVWKKQSDNNYSLASGVQVILDVSNWDKDDNSYLISPSKYTTTTDEEGVFSFTNIPAVPDAYLRTMPYNDGTHDYSASFTQIELIPNSTKKVGDIKLNIAPAIPFVISSNIGENGFGLTENIILTFSKLMQPLTFDISMYSYYFGQEPVEFSTNWDNDITLTINPNYPLQANATYYLELEGKSQDSYNFSETFSFETIEGIQLLSTNLERVDGVFDEFPVNSNIELTFSIPVNIENPNNHVNLYDPDYKIVATELSVSADSMVLVIDPLENFEPGQEYQLIYEIYSYIVGDYDNGSFNFKTSEDITVPDKVEKLEVDYSYMGEDWKPDYNTTLIRFKWNSVSGAEGYLIFAKDSNKNTDFVAIGDFISQDYNTEISRSVNLPNQFDYYEDDYEQTPFCGGTEITFKILAYNDAGKSEFSDPIVLKDETAPEVSIFQTGNADNTTGEYSEFEINMNQVEYCTSSDPTFAFEESGGDPNFVLESSAVSWVWDPDRRDGNATITTTDGKCAAGDMVIISGIADNSGNNAEPDTIYLTPTISFISPTADTLVEAPSSQIIWDIDNTGMIPGIDYVDIFLSIDGGTSWVDTLAEYKWGNYLSWYIPDTLMSDGQAVIGIMDNNGGYIWKSDLFTISGIGITGPGAGEFYDAGGTDSTEITISWESVGIDEVIIEYKRGWYSWAPVDTVANTGSYNWIAPDIGYDYDCKIRVSDFDEDLRPQDESDLFSIIHQ